MSSKANDTLHITFGFRLALLYTAIMAVTVGILFAVTYQLVSHIVQERDHQVIKAQTAQFKAIFAQGGLPAINNYFSQQINPTEPVFVRILDSQNRVRFITVSHPLWNLLDQKVRQQKDPKRTEARWDELSREESEGSWIVGTIPLTPGYYLQVGRSNAESRLVLAHFRHIGLRILLPAIVLSLLVGWFMAHSALVPLRALVQTIRRILDTGDLRERVPASAQRGELGALGAMFNRVLDRNQMLVEGSRETLDNVAHDLRTPMTHLRNSAERALQQTEIDPRMQREALADCMEESERILQMLNVLMDLAEARVGGMTLHPDSFALRELVDEVIELYSIVAEDCGIQLKNDVPPHCTILADRNRLRQCIANLLDNALKYSPEESEVILSGRSNATTVEISVRDHGCGISEEDQGKIWDRLYRCERSRATPGLGLGLSMVWAIIEAHGGTVHVESRLNEGSTFIIQLPRKARVEKPAQI